MNLFTFSASVALLCSSAAGAVAPDPHLRPFATQAVGSQEEYTKLIKSAESISPYDGGLFGESVNLYSGATEFSVTDVSLPGNSAIPVAFGRRFVVESRGGSGFMYRYALGDWDMEVPHISGVFIASLGWTVDLAADSPGGQSNLRCAGPANIDQARPPVYPSTAAQYDLQPEDYWQGTSLYVPGQGNQELLLLTNPNVSRPADGKDYRWVSKGQWFFACTPLLNGSGEGFLARSPDGLIYQFNYMVTLPHPGVVQKFFSGGGINERLVERSQVRLYVTSITDRFGSSVTYTWSGDRLQSIGSSDGRLLTLAYGTNGKISSVTDPASRQWTYTYDGSTLQTVTLPDSSTWALQLDRVQWGETYYWSPPEFDGPTCDKMQRLDPVLNVRSASITHPSGARGEFTFDVLRHGRTSVSSVCIANDDPPDSGHNLYPTNFDTLGIKSKRISGIGVDYTWRYDYQSPTGCVGSSTCPDRKLVDMTAPDGSHTVSTFGIRFEENEAQLLVTTTYAGTGELLQQREYAYVTSAEVANHPFPNTLGDSPQPRIDAFFSSRLRPQKQRVTTQDGATFSWSASTFDRYTNPTAVTRASSLGFSRNEATLYHHNTALWVLSQIASVTETGTGAVMRSNTYDPATATLTGTQQFGQPATTMTYNVDGTVRTHKVGTNPVTTLTNYKRGLAQDVALPDGNTFSVVVNDIGQITSLTNAATYTTGYGYDLGGRLNRITYPTGDTPAWNDTTLVFAPVAGTEFGLPDGHWKQTVSTGNARSETYFDALWRPVLARSYDTANVAGTQRMSQRRFDHEGRSTFVSYPKASIASYLAVVDGTSTTYDALSRVRDVVAASELGPLKTSTRYANGFEKQVTNPRLNITTMRFQAFDEPNEEAPVAITAPLAALTTIVRDAFGKPTSMTRSGFYEDAPVSATRTYVYDVNQRLCKTIEPESGATIQAYDTANRVAWKATGQTLTSTASCDLSNVATNQKISYSYDALNRLRTTTYGDNSPSVTRTYTPDGLPETVTSDNSVWTTTYNRRRLATTETLRLDGVNYPLGYTYTANGHVASLKYPDNTAVDYVPNALGEATQAGNYATAITRHPNGALKSFVYGNGIAHTTEQYPRGLPSRSQDGAVLNDSYAYDKNGNVASITDNAFHAFTRTMEYDALDRLTKANNAASWNGDQTYDYDPLDNLRASTTPTLSWRHEYNATTQRLTRIVDANTNGTLIPYTYDPRGRVATRGAQTFTVDLADRIRQIAPFLQDKVTYRYDGYSRRTKTTKPPALKESPVTTVQVYSPAGQLVYQVAPVANEGIFKNGFQSSAEPYPASTGGTTRYVYLGRHLIAKDGTAGRRYVHTDGLGSPVVETDASQTTSERNYYLPYGWGVAAQSEPGFTGHVADAETGLSYMQARYYDPYAGRFLSTDPVAAGASSFNRYWYANNNPYTKIDPDGRFPLGATVYGGGTGDSSETRQAQTQLAPYAVGLVPGTAAAGCIAGACSPLLWTMAALDVLPAAGKGLKLLAKGVEVVRALRGGKATAETVEAVTFMNPKSLLGRQGPDEMSGSQIKRMTKDMNEDGYEGFDPIDVADVDGKKIIVDGHHRAAAASRAGIRMVPVRVVPASPEWGSKLLIEAAEAQRFRR